jgi:radical SAM protein with 4Fe4S-binding SPASM domain
MPTDNRNLPQNFARVPHRFVLQWHITDACNSNCSHCYRDTAEAPIAMDVSHRKTVIRQYETLIQLLRSRRPVRGLITITGGEPFLDPGLPSLLQLLHGRKESFSFAILSNGTLIDPEIIELLHSFPPSYVQVSLDGMQPVHDGIRGQGAFLKAVQGIRRLVDGKIRTLVSFTASRSNYRELPRVAAFAGKLGTTKMWTDRMIPLGQGGSSAHEVLGPMETLEYCRLLRSAKLKSSLHVFRDFNMTAGRSLQFLKCGGDPYACNAGSGLLAILPNGDVYPCRRLPKKVGRIPDQTLSSIYITHPYLEQLRNPERISSGCERCRYGHTCRGGARCMAYALRGTPFTADPGCWKADSRCDESEGYTADTR